jgi:subtilisin family serine protease
MSSPWPGKGAGVIVAIIDTGIDIFHDSFKKNPTTTRILDLWDQALTTMDMALMLRALPPGMGVKTTAAQTQENMLKYVGVGPEADLVIVKAIDLIPNDAVLRQMQKGA